MSILTKPKDREIYDVPCGELGKIYDVSVTTIRPNPNQPRKQFDPNELTQLAKSITQDGIIAPLTVRKMNGYFELVSGERRLRAAKLAGLRSVPCIMANISEERSAVLALIENIQRSNLTFFEEADAVSKLIQEYHMTQEETALRLGMAQSTVANKLRLLRLTAEERIMITTNGLTERHARALLKLTEENTRKHILLKIIESKMNVEQSEKYIQTAISEEKMRESYRKRAPVLKDIRLFVNTINKAVSVMKLSGVNADTRKVQGDGYVEYIITIAETQETKNV